MELRQLSALAGRCLGRLWRSTCWKLEDTVCGELSTQCPRGSRVGNRGFRSQYLLGSGVGTILPGHPMACYFRGLLHCPVRIRFYRVTRGPNATELQAHVVDLRSDTVSKPSAEMRQAMAEAEVGDDVYGEDPTVNELQQRVAELLGTEDALFVSSGTMGNLISVMCHCRTRGAELLLGATSHLHIYEQGGVAQIAGVHHRTVRDVPDGRPDLQELECKIQQQYPDPHVPLTRLICLENTHCTAGGRVLPISYLQDVRQLADCHSLAVHMDGARLLNAAVALGVAPALITQHCDSVSMCLSKGLGAPVGAMIAGRRHFIKEARRVRKVLGGAMRQVGVLAAPALVGLLQAEEKLKNDHCKARTFAQGVHDQAAPFCSVDLASVESNIVLLSVDEPRISPQEFCDHLQCVSEEEIAKFGHGTCVLMQVFSERTLRAVWYDGISAEDTELALQKLQFVLQKYREELTIT
ncbi:probable low-specificity L-threonine aldolase 2 isoform X2 [Rhinatrema bivittatum]|uniref:probable low-specificity L-threonine aldolase 2 isoform X2 n=1 Tax=Rhinatrema bivittatum TaxID=194408 RepID=UPI0011287E8E|nr:probable low-specificity L-threonine aldolase 2 isoform X2 [Rhinatrema bivittatum]